LTTWQIDVQSLWKHCLREESFKEFLTEVMEKLIWMMYKLSLWSGIMPWRSQSLCHDDAALSGGQII